MNLIQLNGERIFVSVCDLARNEWILPELYSAQPYIGCHVA